MPNCMNVGIEITYQDLADAFEIMKPHTVIWMILADDARAGGGVDGRPRGVDGATLLCKTRTKHSPAAAAAPWW